MESVRPADMDVDIDSWSDFLLTSYVRPEDEKWPEQIVPAGSRMFSHVRPPPPPLNIMPQSGVPPTPPLTHGMDTNLPPHLYESLIQMYNISSYLLGQQHRGQPHNMRQMMSDREFVPLEMLQGHLNQHHQNPQHPVQRQQGHPLQQQPPQSQQLPQQHQQRQQHQQQQHHHHQQQQQGPHQSRVMEATPGLLQLMRHDVERGDDKVKQEKADLSPDEFVAMAKTCIDEVTYYQNKLSLKQQSKQNDQETLDTEPVVDEESHDTEDGMQTLSNGVNENPNTPDVALNETDSGSAAVEETTCTSTGIVDVKSSNESLHDMESDSTNDDPASQCRRKKKTHTIHHYPTAADIAYCKSMNKPVKPHNSDLSDDSEHSLTDLITNLGRVASYMRATVECSAQTAGTMHKIQKPTKSPRRVSKDPRQDILKHAYKRRHKTIMDAIIKKQPAIRICKPRRYDMSCFMQKSRFQTKRGKKQNPIRVMNNFSDLKTNRKSDTESLWTLLKSGTSSEPAER